MSSTRRVPWSYTDMLTSCLEPSDNRGNENAMMRVQRRAALRPLKPLSYELLLLGRTVDGFCRRNSPCR